MNFGKTKVHVTTEGCFGCGTRWSSGWRVFAALPIQVAGKEYDAPLHICADCDKRGFRPTVPEGAIPAGQTVFFEGG